MRSMVAGREGSVLKAFYMYGAGRRLDDAEERARTAPTNEKVAEAVKERVEVSDSMWATAHSQPLLLSCL